MVAEIVKSWEEPYSSALTLTALASCAGCEPNHNMGRLIKQPKRGSLVIFCSGQCRRPRLTEIFVVANRWLRSPSLSAINPRRAHLQPSGDNVIACLCLLNNIPVH